jgi:hypothetical protein
MGTRSILLLFTSLLFSACAPQPSAPPAPSDAAAQARRAPVSCKFNEQVVYSAVELDDRRFAVASSSPREQHSECFRFVDDAVDWARGLASRDQIYPVYLCATMRVDIAPNEYRLGCWYMTRFYHDREKPYWMDGAHQAVVEGVERDCTRSSDDERCKGALRAMLEQK